MPLFVHLALEKRCKRSRRDGINRGRRPFDSVPGGIFATPVTRNFYVSHQWLRELRRSGQSPFVGVYFRIPDDELVWIGHYGRAHEEVTAAVASAMFSTSENREGWEVIIPRPILAKEIHRIRYLPQVVGWRYFPEAKGKPPFCTCKYCTRGNYRATRLRAQGKAPET